MALLIVSAAASPLFNDFLIVVSVTDANGKPVDQLQPANFQVAVMASLNHAAVDPRTVSSAAEGPPGFYILQLQKSPLNLPSGHYVLAVAVHHGKDQGQTVATGSIP